MIKLTKLNDEVVFVNIDQIQLIEIIPETKIVFVNKEYLLVQESADDVVDAIIAFRGKVFGYHTDITVERV